jgi:multicomponent Na+:H+ antiporter subunit C
MINLHYILIFTVILLAVIAIINSDNLIKKIIALTMFQSSITIFYILISYKNNSFPPILSNGLSLDNITNPLPHVLMLTAIVVGLGILVTALILIQKIHKQYDTIDSKKILEQIDEY